MDLNQPEKKSMRLGCRLNCEHRYQIEVGLQIHVEGKFSGLFLN